MPASIAVLFALKQEAGGLIDRLTGVVTSQANGFTVHEGVLHERRIVIGQSGPGRPNAKRAAEALIAGHKPAWFISAGFAGGLVDGLKRNDVVRASQVIRPGGEMLEIAAADSDASASALGKLATVRLVTVDDLVSLPNQKRRLGVEYAAQVVDMETHAIAEVCREHGVPLTAIRVISDGVDEELPAEVDRLLRQRTTAGRLGAAVGAIFRRPSSVKDLYKLNENALVASDRLADVLASLIGESLIGERSPQLPTTGET